MDTEVAWYFDFISPFAYLQWRRLQQLQVERLKYRPILFAGLLNRLGTKGPAEIPAKRVFTYQHALWRAQQDGIELNFPRAHPFNPLPALRLCIAAGTTREAIDTVFRYLWEEGNSIDAHDEIEALAHRLGIVDSSSALADAALKRQLRENFDRALADGVFGVPTLVADSHLFWGDDATGMFLDYMRNPAAFYVGAMERVASLPVGQARPQAG